MSNKVLPKTGRQKANLLSDKKSQFKQQNEEMNMTPTSSQKDRTFNSLMCNEVLNLDMTD